MKYDESKKMLLSKLEDFDIQVNAHQGKMMYLAEDYLIEIEKENLYKLSKDGYIIAPFSDMEELCQFIKMDMQLNEKN
ncbi:MAG: hypothetical protein AAF806_17055 [Bacteroidota bacterium]